MRIAELGLESVDHIEIFLAIEDRIGWEIDTSVSYDFEVVAALTRVHLSRPLSAG